MEKMMTTGLSSKLLKLEQEKLKLESEITELKQQQVKEVSALLMCLCEDHSMDPMSLVGSLLETLKDTKTCTQKKEEWLKAASTFRKKNRARLSPLLGEKI